MAKTVITVENLSKSYVINHRQEMGYNALRDVIANKTKSLIRMQVRKKYPLKEVFLALDNVSIEIKEGDRLGIIGRNGSGKSTLLKIISRITEPTKGRVTIDGRVASLLEVGTGFHPELTGRENIFLNGAILGMSKQEISSKFDAIVDFAEIEQFLDTPVKRYSSGMYVRLAFSVAAHLEPEILIVDEVLAVGDSVFQKKCLDRMTDFGKEGRTILFVSHNLSSVEALCTRAILLDKGKLAGVGETAEIAELYARYKVIEGKEIDLTGIERTENKQDIIFRGIRFNSQPFRFGEKIIFDINLLSDTKRKFLDLDLGINIMDKRNNCIIHCTNRFINENFTHTDDSCTYHFEIENNLKPGSYQMVLFLRTEDVIQDVLNNKIGFEIADNNPYGFNDSSQFQGSILPPFSIRQVR